MTKYPTFNNNKVIYLKSLTKDYKPKIDTFPKDILKALEVMGVDLAEGKKPANLKVDKQAGRDFILAHVEEFLHSAVDYTMMDTMKEKWGCPKDLA